MDTTTDKINLFLTTSSRPSTQQPYNFLYNVPNGMITKEKEQLFQLTVSAFYCYNTFYNCNLNYNHFQIVFNTNTGILYNTTDWYLTIGNPNVNDLVSDINNQLSSYLSVSYNKVQNTFSFTRIYAQTNNYYNMYIKPINSQSFLGLYNNTQYLIPTSGTLNSIFCINVNTITAISIIIDGDITFERNNMLNTEVSDVIFRKGVDVARNELIQYEMVDGGERFQYNLCNEAAVRYFSLLAYDQNLNIIQDLPDYEIHLQIAVINPNVSIEQQNKLINYTKESYLILGYIYEILTNVMKYFKIKS